jgi:hypothetical protein
VKIFNFLRRAITAVVFLCLVFAVIPVIPASAAVGTISLSATTGVVGTSITLSGSGFTSGSNYIVYFASTSVLTGTVSGTGTIIGAVFTIPDTTRGAKTVMVTTDGTDTSNSVSFTVTSSVVLNTSTGNVGDTVIVTGHGFGSGLTASVYFDSTVMTTAVTATSGVFSASFTVPAAIVGTHTIRGLDTGGTSPTANYVISPEIVLSPVTQAVGSQISINGTGYKASSVISIYIDSSLVSGTSATTGTTGSFSLAGLAVPVLTGGTHTIAAYDSSSNSASAALTVSPVIILNPVRGAAGSAIAITGSGFGANRAITITYGGSSVTTNPASIATDAKGSFSARFIVPSGSSSIAYAVMAADITYSATASFTLAGGVTVSPSTGIAGATVSVKGINFTVGNTVIVRYEAIQVGSAKADTSGSFSLSFKVPESSGGSHNIVCTDGIDTVSATFVMAASADLSASTGTINSQVSITGQGFAASSKVTISYDSKMIGTGNTGPSGTFTANVTIPASAAGNHTITASDGANTASMTFTVTSGGNLSVSSGDVGSQITVNGNGLGAGQLCSIQWDNLQIATATADASGSITAAFKIPAATRGNHFITISDGSNVVKQQLTVNSSIIISPLNGNVGSTVTLNGSGFAAGKTISVKYDNSQVSASTTDASGSFTASFIAPVSTGGNHQVSVTDMEQTVTMAFAMDSTPPPVPALISPAVNTKAGAQAVFTWTESADPSGITYSLQVASDAAFGNVLISKTGLTSPGYTLIKSEILKSVSKNEPYYWRVQAIDAASNQSSWSTPQSFYVGIVIPVFIIYALFVLALVLVFLIGFALGRRTTR